MNTIKTAAALITVWGICISLAFSQDVKKTITGKIIEEGSKEPVVNALVVISTGAVDPVTGTLAIPVSTDSVYTDTAGVFKKEITVDQNAYGITYRISKNGFQAKNGYTLLATNVTVNLGTITLAPVKITVTGTVLDTGTGNPIPLALVSLRTSIIGIGKPDTVYTDDKGNFKIEIEVTGNQITPTLYYSVEKTGYVTKTGQVPILGLTIDLGKIFLKSGLNKKVTVTGTVLDSVTGLGVPQALVSLRTSSISIGRPDTVYTDDKGYFKKEIEVTGTQITPTLYYSVEKKGYVTKTRQESITGQTVDLGKIILKPGQNKTVTVIGTVINATTQQPIQEAMVLLTTAAVSVNRPDTAYTDEKGNFKAIVEINVISPIEPRIYYAVSKKGFRTVTGQKPIAQDPVDLGTIELTPLPVAVTSGDLKLSNIHLTPTTIEVYSMNGRLLYSGVVKNVRSFLSTGHSSIIVCYKADNKTLFRSKYALTR